MSTTRRPFEPSSYLLSAMIAAAESKCDADVAQARLHLEAKAELFMAKAVEAETVARGRIQRWGV